MLCPQCKTDESLYIRATTIRFVAVNRDGDVIDDDGGDIGWSDDDEATCHDCNWTGKVEDIEQADLDEPTNYFDENGEIVRKI
jgi:hypothetical protein